MHSEPCPVSCFADTETPLHGVTTACCPQPGRPQEPTFGTRKLMMVTPSDLITSQSGGPMSWPHPSDPLPHSLFESLSPDAFREFRSSEHELPWTPCLGPAVSSALPFPTTWAADGLHCRQASRPQFNSVTMAVLTLSEASSFKRKEKAIGTVKQQQLAI